MDYRLPRHTSTGHRLLSCARRIHQILSLSRSFSRRALSRVCESPHRRTTCAVTGSCNANVQNTHISAKCQYLSNSAPCTWNIDRSFSVSTTLQSTACPIYRTHCKPFLSFTKEIPRACNPTESNDTMPCTYPQFYYQYSCGHRSGTFAGRSKEKCNHMPRCVRSYAPPEPKPSSAQCGDCERRHAQHHRPWER